MSIIEETLNRLSEERTKQPLSGHDSVKTERDVRNASAPMAEMPDDTFNALPWSSATQARAQSGKMSRMPVYVVFFAIVVSAAAWFGIQFLENSGPKESVQQAKVTEEAQTQVTVAPAAAPEPAVSPAPVAVMPELPAETLPPPAAAAPVVAAVKPAPVVPAPIPAPVEPAPVPVAAAPVSPPAVVAPVPAAAQPVIVKSTPADVSAPPSSKPITKPPEEKKPVVVAAIEAPHAKAKTVATEVDVSLPSWVSEGRRLLDAKETSGALKAWNAGFGTLPADQRVVAVAAFYDQGVALAALRRLEGFDNAIMVSGNYAGRNAWYLVLHSKPEARQTDLARAMTLTGVGGGAVTGVARINQVVPVHDQSSQPPAKNSAVPSEKEVQDAPKPVAKAQAPAVAEQPESKARAELAAKKETPAPAPKKESKESAGSTTPAMNVHYENQLEQIAKAFNRGSYKESEELARTLLDQNASSSGAWLWVGKSVLARGQFEDAERHLARATEISPNLAEAWTLRGIVAQETGNHAQALKYFSETLQSQPNQAEAYFNIGYSHDALGNRSEAEKNWRRFLDIAKDKPRYAKQRAYVEQHMGAQ